jgi:hypothetical protein
MSRIARQLLVVVYVASTLAIFSTRGIAQSQDQGTSAPAAGKPTSSEDVRPISDKDIQLLREDIRAQRKQLIAINMKLTPTQAEKFWPVYDQYISELVSNNNKKYALIKEFVQSGGALTGAEAENSVQQWISVDESVAALRRKYIPIFAKVLSPREEALFYQLDRRVQLMIDLQLMALIPMIDPSAP